MRSQVAAALADAAIPIFIGRDFCDALVDWPNDRPGVVIVTEALPHYAAPVAPTVDILHCPFIYPTADTTPRARIICADHMALVLGATFGQWCNTQLRAGAFTPEQLEFRVHVADDTPLQHVIASVLAQVLPIVLQAAHWTAQQRPHYRALAQRQRTDSVVVTGAPTDTGALAALTHHLASSATWVPITLPPDIIDPGAPFASTATLTAAATTTATLCQAIAQHSATAIMTRNYSLFHSLEYLLCLAPLLEETDTPLYCGMTDWFTMLGHDFVGGALAPHVRRWLGGTTLRHLTMYPVYSTGFAPPSHPVHTLAYGYLADAPTLRAPRRARADDAIDVLIAHTARNHIRFDTLHPLTQEWLRGLEAFTAQHATTLHPDTYSHRIFLHLHRRIADAQHPLHTHAAQALLTELDFIYYVITRQRLLTTLAPDLASRWRVQLVGTGWAEHCPTVPQCASVSRTELNDWYHRAGVTIFLSSMYEAGVPPPEAALCYAHGGFPLVAAPTVYPDAPSPWPGGAEQHYRFWHTPSDLTAQIAATLNNWPQRNAHIAAVQQDWQHNMHRAHQFPLRAFTTIPLCESPHPAVPSITGNARTDAMLIAASCGYLAALLGDSRTATQQWQYAATCAELPTPAWQQRARQ